MRRLRLFAGGRPVSFASGKGEGDDGIVKSATAKGKGTLVVETPKTAEVIPAVQADASHDGQPSQSSVANQGEPEVIEVEDRAEGSAALAGLW